jgi:hypothetical protein
MGEDVVGFSLAALGTGRTFPVAHMRPKNQEAAANFHVWPFFFVYFGCRPHAPIYLWEHSSLKKKKSSREGKHPDGQVSARGAIKYLVLAIEGKNSQLKLLVPTFFYCCK